MTPRRRGERGFTLLEVLIAFAIAAIALAVLYQGALGGLRGSSVAARVQEATVRARSHMAALGRGTALIAGDQDGDDGGGFRWHTRVVPLGTTSGHRGSDQGDEADDAPRRPLSLFAVVVTISWQQDGVTRQITLESRRLMTAAVATSSP